MKRKHPFGMHFEGVFYELGLNAVPSGYHKAAAGAAAEGVKL